MMNEDIKEVVELLGTNFTISVYIENQDALKTLDVYREALDGVINKNHSTKLLRALTHNLITDFKRFKVDTTKYGSTDSVIGEMRKSAFTLPDAFTALCEVSLPEDECKSVEKAEEIIGHFIHTLTTSLRLSEELYSSLAYADDMRNHWQDELLKIPNDADKAQYVRDYLSDSLYQLLPTPVSDVGDFADNGKYMCGVYLDNVNDILSLLPDGDMKSIYWEHFKAVNKAVEFYKNECDEVLGRMEDFAYDNEQFTNEEVLEAIEEILELSKSYGETYMEHTTDDSDIFISPEEPIPTTAASIGKALSKFYKELIIEPILNGVQEGMKVHYSDNVINMFDYEDVSAVIMTLITAKLNLHDKMALMCDGDMTVSYDGSEMDEDIHATVSNIYHENEADADSKGEQAIRQVPVADILLDTRDVSEGWVNAAFGIYTELTKNI